MISLFILLQTVATSLEPIAQGLASIGAGIIVIGAGLGIGKIGSQAMEAISRQPEATGKISANMLISAAFIEGIAFFALVICILIVL